jgi:hypothetical protein
MTRPAQRRELAEKAVATQGIIAALLEGLTKAHRTCGFGAMLPAHA